MRATQCPQPSARSDARRTSDTACRRRTASDDREASSTAWARSSEQDGGPSTGCLHQARQGNRVWVPAQDREEDESPSSERQAALPGRYLQHPAQKPGIRLNVDKSLTRLSEGVDLGRRRSQACRRDRRAEGQGIRLQRDRRRDRVLLHANTSHRKTGPHLQSQARMPGHQRHAPQARRSLQLQQGRSAPATVSSVSVTPTYSSKAGSNTVPAAASARSPLQSTTQRSWPI